jgi:FkbM family methyltransferase
MSGRIFKKSLVNSIRKRWVSLFPHQTVLRHGIYYKLDCRELIDYHIYFAQWEAETVQVISRVIRPGDTIIEIGANVGSHTLLIGQKAGSNGRVYAIEPTLFARQKLIDNLSLNPELNSVITVHDFLITDQSDKHPKRAIKSSWPSKKNIAERSDETVASPAISVDEFISDNGIERLDFLKIDIDGYDYKALLGAENAIEQLKPIVYIELCEWALNESGDRVDDIFAFFEAREYVAYSADLKSPLKLDFVKEFVGNKGSVNGLFVPESNTDRIQP